MPNRGPVAFLTSFTVLVLSGCMSNPDPIASEAEPSTPTSQTELPAARDPTIAPAPSLKPELDLAENQSETQDTPQSPTAINTAKFPATLSICPRMTVSNAPAANEDRMISNYQPIVDVDGTMLAIAPVESGCFSSGFGLRNGRRHKGIDIYSAAPVNVFAAGDGRVRERVYRDDYGNMLVIEHGDGVFARYAHLERFAPGIEIGSTVKSGQTIGVMGNTASYSIPRHLHYEILIGDYGTLTGSFGLFPVDIFDYLP